METLTPASPQVAAIRRLSPSAVPPWPSYFSYVTEANDLSHVVGIVACDRRSDGVISAVVAQLPLDRRTGRVRGVMPLTIMNGDPDEDDRAPDTAHLPYSASSWSRALGSASVLVVSGGLTKGILAAVLGAVRSPDRQPRVVHFADAIPGVPERNRVFVEGIADHFGFVHQDRKPLTRVCAMANILARKIPDTRFGTCCYAWHLFAPDEKNRFRLSQGEKIGER